MMKDIKAMLMRNEPQNLVPLGALQNDLVEKADVEGDSVALYYKDGAMLMISSDNAEDVRTLLRRSGTRHRVYGVTNTAMRDVISAFFGHPAGEESDSFWQFVYWGSEPPARRGGCELVPLTLDDADMVNRHYHPGQDRLGYIQNRIEHGPGFRAVIDGETAGFVLTHEENAIGLLEVLPAYRRRGLGFELMAEIIREALARGMRPYCDVAPDNEASIRLQLSLGMERLEQQVGWVSWREED